MSEPFGTFIDNLPATTLPSAGDSVYFRNAGTNRRSTVADLTRVGRVINIVDYGGVADGATDNTAALNAAIAANSWNISGPNGPGFATGPRIYFPGGASRYFFATTIQLKDTVILEGDTTVGNGSGNIGTAMASVLQFPVNTTGIIVQTYNTIDFTTQSPTTSGGDGSTIRNLAIVCGDGTFDQPGNPIDITGQKSGIYCRAQTFIRDVIISGFAGDGIHIEATSGAGGAGEGQASGCLVDNVAIQKCMRYGFFQAGGDTNASLFQRMNIHTSGCAGLVDRTFLGSTHIQPQFDAFVGQSANTFGYVTYGGNVYQLISSNTGDGSATTPGTNDLIWYNIGTTAALPGVGAPWSSSATYLPCCAILTQGNDHTIVIIGPYLEGGLPAAHVSSGTTVWPTPSNNSFTYYSQQIGNSDGLGLGISATTNLGTVLPYLNSGTTEYILSWLGEQGVNPVGARANGGFFGTWMAFRDTLNWPQTLRWASNAAFYSGGTQNTTDLFLSYGVGFSPTMQYISGPNTGRQFGTTAAVPFVVGFPIIGLGEELFGTPARRLTTGTVAPTSGTWAHGDFVFNVAPATNGTFGWTCVTGGTPGTWTAVGIIIGGQTVVASLPSASTAGSGARAFVTDATVTTFASVVAGSGANHVPVYSDGTSWRIG